MDELMALYDRDTLQVRPGLEPTPDRLRMYHGYMAMVSGVDRAFGQLMAKLRERGLEDNTLTLFSADHGDMLESHEAILPKQYPHDYSNHIPFIVRYPGVVPEGTNDLLFGALDIMPTVLGLMDIDTDQDYDGRDLSEAIERKDEDVVDYVPIWLYKRGVANNQNWRGVITRDYTFAVGRGEDSIALTNVLFDREQDPYQLDNHFYDAAYAPVKDSLRALTFEWMDSYNDKFYGEEEFLRIRPEETWMYNYTQSPAELFAEEEKGQ
jgi:arylsulfatase A-like enzyme